MIPPPPPSGSDAPLMFVYRHSAVRSEVDDLRDAVLLFHPADTPLDRQCLLAGQLMGLTGFIRIALLSQPVVFELDSGLRVACLHSPDGDLTLCIGTATGAAGGDAAVREAALQLHKALQFFRGPLALAFGTATRHQPELQALLTPLAARLLALFCPGASGGIGVGLASLTSGRLEQVSLTPRRLRPRQRNPTQAGRHSQELRRSSRSRLLLAADCLADRLVGCCADAGVGRVLGCAVFVTSPSSSSASSPRLLTSTGLPAWLCVALSLAVPETTDVATSDVALHRVDLPAAVLPELDAFAFHAFVPSEDWPATQSSDVGEEPRGCVGRCGRGFIPRLAQLCESAVIRQRLRRLAHLRAAKSTVTKTLDSSVIHCQCIVWRLPAAANSEDPRCLRLAAIFDGFGSHGTNGRDSGDCCCAGCVRAVASALLTPAQLRPLTSAFAAVNAADTCISEGDEGIDDDGNVDMGDDSLVHCPQLLAAPSTADFARLFPDDAALALAALAVGDSAAAASAGEASASFAIRVDGRPRVSATRRDGFLSLSAGVGGDHGDGIPAVFPRRRRGYQSRTSISGGGGGINGAGGFLLVPASAPVSTPRRTRSLIGSWRPTSRGKLS